MNVKTYFEEQKGINVDAAINAGSKYTAIDMCRFAENYHESEVSEQSKRIVELLKENSMLKAKLSKHVTNPNNLLR